MLLDQNSELQLRATRPKPLVLSILVHVVLLLIVAFNPGWFETTPHRVIRIAGEDFDLSQLELRQLVLPPRYPAAPRTPPPVPVPVPVPVPAPQLTQPQQAAPPPPPPPPAQPTPPPPDRIIRPDDQLIEGARPDGTPRASRGDTRDQAQAGGPKAQEAQDAQEAQQALRGQRGQQTAGNRSESGLDRIRPSNANPDALRAPTIGDVNRVVEAQLDVARRNGAVGRTGTARGDNNGTFSAEPQILSPNPKGIDFGPYLNQLLTRLRSNWYAVMPEIARLGQKGRVDIVFTVSRSGMVKDLQVVAQSGVEALDKGALSAIHLSNPFPSLPAEYETDLKLRIAFLYNMYP